MKDNPANEFEPVQSDAGLRSLLQSLEKQVQSLSTSLQSAQDAFSKIQEFQSSINRELNRIDTGNDEAEAGTVQGESGGRSVRRLLSLDSAQGTSNAFQNSVNEGLKQTGELGGLRVDKQLTNNNAYSARVSSDQFWTDLIRFKAVSGEVDPDSLLTVLKELNGNKSGK